MARTLVTGATGLLGSHLVRALADRGDELRLLIKRGSDTAALDGIDYEEVTGDVTDRRAVRRAVEGVERVGAAREDLRMWFAIDTLEYLRRGGRIGAARAWMGSALQIKPILTLDDEITPVERVRTRRRVFERLVQYAQELKDNGNDAWVVQHIRDPENAQRLVERCREVMGSEPLFISEIGPVIGAHTGPGLLGVGGVPAKHLA